MSATADRERARAFFVTHSDDGFGVDEIAALLAEVRAETAERCAVAYLNRCGQLHALTPRQTIEKLSAGLEPSTHCEGIAAAILQAGKPAGSTKP